MRSDATATMRSFKRPLWLFVALAQRAHRLLRIHRNVPGILAQINSILAEAKCNILGQYLKTNEQIGYVITDVNKKYEEKIINQMKSIPDTIKFRILY